MTDVKSKNLYELLGNTSDQDSDREPELPTQTKDKPSVRHGKRDAPKAAPAAPAAATESADTVAARGRGGNRRGGFTGNEAAFRDRATGRNKNREQAPEENDDSGRGGRGRGRGRGGPRRGGDRHSRTGIGEHQKQADHGWGESTGQGEWQDEKAGQEIANEEKKEGGGTWDADKNDTWNENAQPAAIPEEGTAAAPEADAEAEPEDNSKSYADYLAEQNAKRMKDLGLKEARAPNEGSKENKKWKSAKELTKEEDENYFKGEEKARRQRERGNAKQLLDIDYAFKEESRGDSRGGRGGRGGRGRGRGDGDRGDRGDRGDFRGRGRGDGDRGDRGDFRGRGRGDGDRGDRGDFRGRGRGDGDRGDRGDFRGRGRGRGGDSRGEFRGGRGDRGRGRPQGDGAPVAVNDESAFPSLGGK